MTGTTTALSVLGADDAGESNLTYTWATTGTPPAPVTFSDNGDNTAKNTTATFSQAGNYTFQVTITDVGGLTATSSVDVAVSQTLDEHHGHAGHAHADQRCDRAVLGRRLRPVRQRDGPGCHDLDGHGRLDRQQRALHRPLRLRRSDGDGHERIGERHDDGDRDQRGPDGGHLAAATRPR